MSLPNDAAPNGATPTLSVGTFNVRCDFPADGGQRWGHRRDRVADLLRGWGPDLLGLQEPLSAQLGDIRRALPAYEAAGVGRDDGRAAGEFCPVLFRRDRLRLGGGGTFWFSDTPQVPGSRGWGNRITRLCTWVSLTDLASGAAFLFYNLHLDHESQPARERSVGLLLDHIRARPAADPVIVAGDFNAEPDNPAVAAMGAADSPVPTSALAGRAGGPAGTFHGFTGEPAGGAIDHIFVSPEWEVLDAHVRRGDGMRPFPSDHFPVAATLRLRGKPGDPAPAAR